MRNYYMLDFEEDYNMKDISSKLSCDNMSLLSKGYTEYQNRKELFQDLRFIQNEIEKHQMDIDKRNELEEEEHCIIDRLKELGYKNL